MIKPISNGIVNYVSKKTGTSVTMVYNSNELISKTVIPGQGSKSFGQFIFISGLFNNGKIRAVAQKTTNECRVLMQNCFGKWLVY